LKSPENESYFKGCISFITFAVMDEKKGQLIKKPGIIFMGTPEFAVASLKALVEAGYPVLAVVTAPDKPAGRGLHLKESAVKQYAVRANIPVLQPEKLRNPEFLDSLKKLGADLQVVVAFRMLPELVWNMPPMGTLNVHGSLLPQYRGAAPINWAIINGEQETGVTTFKLQHAIDTGDLLLQEKIQIEPNETAGQIHDRMMEVGAQVLVKTIEGLMEDSIVPMPQNKTGEALLHAPKIFTDTCKIDPAQSVSEVHNLIRGLSPFPGAFIYLGDKTFKIYESEISENLTIKPIAGTWYIDNKNNLMLGCKGGFVSLKLVQLEGKKKMPVSDFLRGFRWPEEAIVQMLELP
jgi:methionyl-tRNA formyltransferase